ncbi:MULTISPECIES: TetR/AcrR family transcriptional regulator [unclassified Pseudomonas]|uniref:TetR/AcrR family transcriptional regulator n=1 Tax=unclassified Pseudomonas TaxID=196821 RepID=UPI000D3AA915|nr:MULTISPECIES: TetR/AcrR family transcriptional regulator [unclassified Pseudomonas]RAU49674.1 TetR/AcrR family transcriptional regulator [Pseudomonas sp. RIT 409]RAU55587.1 TetR/AcrR family transcriptional regulator [Pseudomonas sp. RIT 412]
MTMDTRETIMTVARKMVQTRGYNGLSFRELAKEVGIKSASIHYHFPTKGDLGSALARRYTEDGIAYLSGLREDSDDLNLWMKGYTEIFRMALVNDNRMCLCGIMAAEYDDLPPEVRVEVDNFTDVNVRWLNDVLSVCRPQLTDDERLSQALAIYAAVEGAQLVARGRGDIAVFDTTIQAYRTAGLLP